MSLPNSPCFQAASIVLAVSCLLQPGFGQDGLPTAQELHDEIKRIQDRYAGHVFEVDGVALDNSYEKQRPFPFHARVDERRIWLDYGVPALDGEPLKVVGAVRREVGAVDGVRVRITDIENEPSYSVATAELDWTFADLRLLTGIFLSFGELRELGRDLNQDESSFLRAIALHPSTTIERHADNSRQLLMKCSTDALDFRVVLETEPEIHCTQLEVFHKKSIESAFRTSISYHRSDIGWIPKSCSRNWGEVRNLIVTYNAVRLRNDVPDHEFLPMLPEGVEIRASQQLQAKLRRIQSGPNLPNKQISPTSAIGQ